VFLLEKLTQGLKKTRDALLDQVAALAPGRSLVSDDYERLEVALLSADVGPSTTDRILDAVKRRLADRSFHGEPIDALRIEIEALLGTGDHVTGESAPAPPPDRQGRQKRDVDPPANQKSDVHHSLPFEKVAIHHEGSHERVIGALVTWNGAAS